MLWGLCSSRISAPVVWTHPALLSWWRTNTMWSILLILDQALLVWSWPDFRGAFTLPTWSWNELTFCYLTRSSSGRGGSTPECLRLPMASVQWTHKQQPMNHSDGSAAASLDYWEWWGVCFPSSAEDTEHRWRKASSFCFVRGRITGWRRHLCGSRLRFELKVWQLSTTHSSTPNKECVSGLKLSLGCLCKCRLGKLINTACSAEHLSSAAHNHFCLFWSFKP